MTTKKKRYRSGRFRPAKWTVLLLAIGGFYWGWSEWNRPESLLRAARSELDLHPDRSASLLEEAVGLRDGNFPEAQLLWSRALLRMGRRQEASGCFSLIHEPSRLSSNDLVDFGSEAFQSGNHLLAVMAYDAVPITDSKHNQAITGLQQIMYAQGNWAEVTSLHEQSSNDGKSSPETLLMTADSFARLGDLNEAVNHYRQFLDTARAGHSQQHTALTSLVSLSIQLGELKEARLYLQRLNDERTKSPIDLILEAKLLRLEGNAEVAFQMTNRVMKSEPGLIEALELRGTLTFDRGAWADAIQDFLAVAAAQPWNKQAHYKLAQAYRHLGKTAQSDRHFARNREINEALTRILELTSMEAKGVAEVRRLRDLARAYKVLGRTDAARRFSDRAAQLEIDSD